MSKRNSEHSKSESSEELGAVARYAIDKLVPKITEEIEKSIKSPGHKGAIQVVQSVNYLAEGILSLLQSHTPEHEQAVHQEHYTELKRFLLTAHDVIYKKPIKLSNEDKKYLPSDLTELEKQRQQEKAEIRNKYIRKVECDKVKKTFYGANIRKWWVDKNMPLDEDGHPDLRWISEIEGWKEELTNAFMAADLSGFNLSGLRLSELNLQVTNFSAAIMHGVMFDKVTKLSYAQMVLTDLTGAYVSDTLMQSEDAKSVTLIQRKGDELREYLAQQHIVLAEAVFVNEAELDALEFTLVSEEIEDLLDGKEEKTVTLSNCSLVNKQDTVVGKHTQAVVGQQGNVVMLEAAKKPSPNHENMPESTHAQKLQQQQSTSTGFFSSLLGGGRN